MVSPNVQMDLITCRNHALRSWDLMECGYSMEYTSTHKVERYPLTAYFQPIWAWEVTAFRTTSQYAGAYVADTILGPIDSPWSSQCLTPATRTCHVVDPPQQVTTDELKVIRALYRIAVTLRAWHRRICSWSSAWSLQLGQVSTAPEWIFALWWPVLFQPWTILLTLSLVGPSNMRYAKPKPSISMESQIRSSAHSIRPFWKKAWYLVPLMWKQMWALYLVWTLWPFTIRVSLEAGTMCGLLLDCNVPDWS